MELHKLKYITKQDRLAIEGAPITGVPIPWKLADTDLDCSGATNDACNFGYYLDIQPAGELQTVSPPLSDPIIPLTSLRSLL